MTVLGESLYPVVEANGSHHWASVINGCHTFIENDVCYEAHDGLVETRERGQMLFRIYVAGAPRIPSLTTLFEADPERFRVWADAWRLV